MARAVATVVIVFVDREEEVVVVMEEAEGEVVQEEGLVQGQEAMGPSLSIHFTIGVWLADDWLSKMPLLEDPT